MQRQGQLSEFQQSNLCGGVGEMMEEGLVQQIGANNFIGKEKGNMNFV